MMPVASWHGSAKQPHNKGVPMFKVGQKVRGRGDTEGDIFTVIAVTGDSMSIRRDGRDDEHHGIFMADWEAVLDAPTLCITTYGSEFRYNVEAALNKAKILYTRKQARSRGDIMDFFVPETKVLTAKKAIDDYYKQMDSNPSPVTTKSVAQFETIEF